MTGDLQRRRIVRETFMRRVFWIALGILIALVAALQLVTSIQTNRLAEGITVDQAAGAERGRGIDRTVERIESCTTPGQACFQQSQKATAEAVEKIGAANRAAAAAAAACAARLDDPTYERILACVNRSIND